jgi:hypothetical protein
VANIISGGLVRLQLEIDEEEWELIIWALLLAQVVVGDLGDHYRVRQYGKLALMVRANENL